MPINLSVEYPKLENENMKLRYQRIELVKALTDCLEEINQLNRKLGRLNYTQVEKDAIQTLENIKE